MQKVGVMPADKKEQAAFNQVDIEVEEDDAGSEEEKPTIIEDYNDAESLREYL